MCSVSEPAPGPSAQALNSETLTPKRTVGLSDIAAGIEVTDEQRDRGVASVDDTDTDLAERLSAFAADLPCSASEAATLVESYAAGKSVGGAARAAGLAPATGARTLHRLGEPVCPLSPVERDVVRDFLDARMGRTDAVSLVGSETEFALGVYCETHDPIPGAVETLEGALAVESSDPLADARSDVGDLL